MYYRDDGYPPGTLAPREFTITMQCENEKCDSYKQTWDMPMIDELGGQFSLNEDLYFCEICGEEAVECDSPTLKRSHA